MEVISKKSHGVIARSIKGLAVGESVGFDSKVFFWSSIENSRITAGKDIGGKFTSARLDNIIKVTRID